MDWQSSRKEWFCDDSAAAESAFRDTLLRLKAQGASNQEISENVIRSPFVLGLLWVVTSSRYCNRLSRKGARPPANWEDWLSKETGLRDEWRCEALLLLGERLRAEWDKKLDLERVSIGGYWRMKVLYAAIKAAWNLYGESRLKVRRTRRQVKCDTDGVCRVEDTRPDRRPIDFDLKLALASDELEEPGQRAARRLSLLARNYRQQAGMFIEQIHEDLSVVIEGLEKLRQRQVMRLTLLGHNYPKIARLLTEQNGPGGKEVTFEMVRYAHKKGVAALRKRLRPAA
jgi:hypothetical protein